MDICAVFVVVVPCCGRQKQGRKIVGAKRWMLDPIVQGPDASVNIECGEQSSQLTLSAEGDVSIGYLHNAVYVVSQVDRNFAERPSEPYLGQEEHDQERGNPQPKYKGI